MKTNALHDQTLLEQLSDVGGRIAGHMNPPTPASASEIGLPITSPKTITLTTSNLVTTSNLACWVTTEQLAY